ncbi:unnamed protein product [Allacma fusca]|uniref:Uncharacterized protein n=1 Tax=Allacma fusca TaxID=39272 RepID=A0A8J2K0H6_9HEXA|nr:unnamed protein product [Allacma fusca]
MRSSGCVGPFCRKGEDTLPKDASEEAFSSVAYLRIAVGMEISTSIVLARNILVLKRIGSSVLPQRKIVYK